MTDYAAVRDLIARRLTQRRQELRLSLAQVGDCMGLSLQQIHRYEIGANVISAPVLWRLARCLRTDVGYFFKDEARSDH